MPLYRDYHFDQLVIYNYIVNICRFVPSKFEELFKKHAHTHSDALTSDELMELLKGNRVPKDYKGW